MTIFSNKNNVTDNKTLRVKPSGPALTGHRRQNDPILIERDQLVVRVSHSPTGHKGRIR